MKFRTKITFAVALAFLLVISVVWFCCGKAAGSGKIRNVLLISIDTCRPDYISCYGYPLETTPTIDAIAGEGILFENVVTPIPLTLPAHCSMLTGTIPPHHGIHDNLNYSLASSHVTLAEMLSQEGYATSAFISAVVLDSRFGLDQGFDMYDDRFENSIDIAGVGTTRPGEETTRKALEWFEKNDDKDFFMFLHYYDLHAPYDPPAPFDAKFQDAPYSQTIASRYQEGFYAGEIARYAGEMAYVDHCIGQVVEKLKTLGLYDSTLIIVTGDHGEMLGEHGEDDHGYFIYQSAVKVPLILKLPGQSRSRKVSGTVGLIDIVPTVCDLLGIDSPALEGKSLSPYWSGKPVPDKPMYYCECLTPTKYHANSLLGVVGEQFKYIQTTRPELYDLSADPLEQCNLIAEQPHRGRILQDQLQQILEQSVGRDRSDSSVELDPEGVKRLESLGYVAGQVSESFEFDQDKDDPKDVIGYHVDLTHVNSLMAQKQYAAAKKLCAELISQRPQSSMGHFQMALAVKELGNLTDSAKHFQKAVDLDPDNYAYHNHLAKVYNEQGEFDRACTHLETSLRLNPHQADAHVELAVVFSKREQYEAAVSHLLEALRLRPDEPAILNKLGAAYGNLQDAQQAVRYWSESLRLDPDQPGTLNQLAIVYHGQGQTAKAIEQWYAALEAKPDWVSVLNNLAWVQACSENEAIRNPEEAVKLAWRAGELTHFNMPEILDSLSAALASMGKYPEAAEAASKAVEMARSAGREDLAGEIQGRLELYKNAKPYREKEHHPK